MNDQQHSSADALTEAQRKALETAVNVLNINWEHETANELWEAFTAPVSQPAAALIARVQVCGDEITLSATSDQRAVLMTMHDAPIYAEPPAATSANETGADGAAELESMTRMFHAACYDLGLINEALGLDPDDGGAEPILDAIAELRAQIASAQTDEPVAWAVYNGWSRICFYMTEEDARDHAQKAQKNHDLSGSLAAFRVVPLYAAPQPARAATPDAEAVNWRELSRRLYVELFHCDQQMRSTRDEDGEPHWTQSAVVRDVLADAKAALDGAPQPAQADTIQCQAHSGPDCTECGG
ncbi:hypothetical protein C6V04_17555, partial [Burkholderia multivorans]